MKITINGAPYDTQNSETICQRFTERVDDTSIEQVQETIYRTDEGQYFSYTWKFHDSEENDIEEDCITENVRIITAEELILWLRIDGLARRFQYPPTVFSLIGKAAQEERQAENISEISII